MPLTHTKDLFAKALKGKYAIGAFNVNNMELLQAIVEACEEEKAPVMLQISKGARQYANPVYLKKLIEAAVSLSNIPIAVHLDHGDTFELCKDCIDEGFTSVMIDASHEPFDKNIEISRKVAEYAHARNCVVEAELGHLVGAQFDDGEEGGSYSKEGHYTNPEQAVDFVKRSGVDSLAIAIGNSHGAYKFKGEQHLDLERLKAIKKALMDGGLGDYPLVLHGASSVPKDLVEEINKYGGKLGTDTAGVPEADIEVARRIGCTKVNIDTDLRLAMTAGIRKAFAENPKEFDPRKYMGPARNRVKELVRHKVRNVLCCASQEYLGVLVAHAAGEVPVRGADAFERRVHPPKRVHRAAQARGAAGIFGHLHPCGDQDFPNCLVVPSRCLQVMNNLRCRGHAEGVNRHAFAAQDARELKEVAGLTAGA